MYIQQRENNLKIALIIAFAFSFLSSPVIAQDNPAEFFRSDPYRVGGILPSPTRARSAARPAPRVGGAPAHFAAAAQRHGVPVSVAMATIRHESGGRCNARGRAGELGPLQIKPATARGLGYSGPTGALATCGAGLEWGMRHLAIAYRKCGHVGPHNYGLGGGCRRTAYVYAVMRRA